ncbi:hypothetical protein [Hoylesella timonensis]|uniref:Uncharacterized protein n=1 Tax=Hoylesella timonensis TaxID=386414 RepID=A0A2N6Q4A7_9BACT|nr:hypothetical protein [Hoylesella timonensis]PMC08765.1 hypothetical protein CJ232_09055 [Hoylesella timonensis]
MLNYNYIWICIAIVIFGIIDILIKVYQTKKEDSNILLFWNMVHDLYNKNKNKSDIENEIQYIISKSKYIDRLLTKNSLYSPVFHFVNEISQGNYANQGKFLTLINKYIIQHEEDNKNKRIGLWKALLNPIELFCRGIELLLRYCFAYFLSMIKSDFDYDGKTWKFVVGIISFISAVLTILGFFGITFNTINSYYN